MATQIKLRRDTAANWTANNTVVLAAGEAGFETDTSKLKIGNGTNTWASLDYVIDLSDVHTNIVPRTDNTYDLGSPAKQWRHVYTAGGSIYLDNIKLTNVNGKFVATKVVNPGEENEEDDPEDSDATSAIGGGVNGLTGRTDFTPDSEGDTRYELNINGDIKLRTHQQGTGPGNLGVGISLGNTSTPIRSGVIAIGNNDVGYDSKQGGVYIGYEAGWNDAEDPQGEYAIAIGARAARNFAQDNSITLNATGANLDPTADGLYIKPIRESSNSKALYYNTTTGEITYDDSSGGSTSYTPDNTDNWNEPTINTISAALDELAARLTAIQNFEYDGGNANTPELGELLIDGNGA